ncbi:MAG: sulfite exporter TauE/SafE family protein [Desulfobacterales bacterium]|nr:sulfite exporter TauE/SafE family protein [Desulfobacterales bacterium]
MMPEYWFMLPVSILVACVATGSGFGGGIIFFPIFIFALDLSVPMAVGTGMITELCGMTSAIISYTRQKQVEFEIAMPMIIISFPGLLIGLHIVRVLNPAYSKLFFGFVVLLCGLWVLHSLRERGNNTRSGLFVEDMIPYAWVPFLGGVSSGITSVGTAEMVLPLLERRMKLEMHRAIATTVVVEGAVGWLATAVNIWEGQICWDVAIFTTTGVIIGGRLGPMVSRQFAPKPLKLVFSFFVILASLQIIRENAALIF